ncbi:MAG: TetR/AcrR family transcriptional regulator [Burkholderiaceae bacterium]|jgi:AcrR family transcriptional regulator|nr:TetR/AcrR family transcriptional regulator [Gammaproteobacteria bacterium]MBK9468708.1 TetR/AcrR family transcriptional regulator [Gammaproteobacteria bacterium]MBP7660176.1 TetR/AcrR family transcriptional regulator [Burkholderiaceae bacterium]
MSPAAQARKPGRPSKTADDPDRRTRILEIAVSQFGRSGIAGTSLSAIAREARVTPALMHYYFGNRESLIDAIVAEKMQPAMAGVVEAMKNAGNDLRSQVHCFVRTMIETIASRPWLPPLWTREVLSEGGMLRERLVGRFGAPLGQKMRDRFADAQSGGQLNHDLDPNLLFVTLIALTLFPLASQPIWRHHLGADDVTADTIANHALALLERGLEMPT